MKSPEEPGGSCDGKTLVVLFRSTQHAIRAEAVLKNLGLDVTLRPVPRHLSSECGVCLAFSPEMRKGVEQGLSEKGIEYERIEVL